MGEIVFEGRRFPIEGDEPTKAELDGMAAAIDAEKSQPQDQSLVQSVSGGLNRGIAQGFGAPVDLANWLLSLAGAGSEEPVGGSKWIESSLADAGMAYEPDAEIPNEFVGRVAEEVGATMMPLGALGATARVAKTGGKYLEPVVNFIRNRPGAFTATEVASATGAGTGAAIAQQAFPDNELAEITGQLIGGLATPTTLFTENSPQVIASVKRMIGTITPGGAKSAAADVVQNVVRGDPKKVAAQISKADDTVEGAVFTSAGESGDKGLLALEKALMKKSSELSDELQETFTKTNDVVRSELRNFRGNGSIENTREFFDARVKYLNDLVSARSAVAMDKAKTALAKLSPGSSRENANKIVRREIESALSDARAQENQLWGAVEDAVPASTQATKDRYTNILANRDIKVDDPEDIPKYLDSLLNPKAKSGLDDIETVGRLQKLRSRVLADIRAERGKEVPNYRKVSILSEVEDSLLDDMASMSDDVSLTTAREFSRGLSQRFKQGTVGKLLGYEKTGEESVDAAMTLERTMRPGPQSGVAADDFVAASQPGPIGRAPEVQNAIGDFLRDRFIRKFPDGKVSTSVARRFMADNAAILERRPDLKNEFQLAIDTQDVSGLISKSSGRVKAGINQASKGAATTLLNAPVSKEVKKVISSKNPQKLARELKRIAVKDKSGKALSGLKAQFIDEAWGSAETGVLDLDGNKVISGRKFSEYLEVNKPVVNEWFTQAEKARFERIAKTASKIEAEVSRGSSIEKILESSPDMLTDMIVSVAGARAGAAIGGQTAGGSIQTAGRGAGIARKFAGKIPLGKVTEVLNQAVLDKELMVTLLKKPKTITEQIELERALRGFLVNILPEGDAETTE